MRTGEIFGAKVVYIDNEEYIFADFYTIVNVMENPDSVRKRNMCMNIIRLSTDRFRELTKCLKKEMKWNNIMIEHLYDLKRLLKAKLKCYGTLCG